MLTLTVLSPHRDDAVFSLFVCLSRWSALSVKLKIVNFFTISGYAPYAGTEDVETITAIREAEDLRAFSLISSSLEVIDCGLLDAPLRFDIPVCDVFEPELRSVVTEEAVNNLTPTMQSVSDSDLFLAPLGLGGHLDHLVVREAAMRTAPGESLGFYEDLPYAMWTSEEDLQRTVGEMTANLGPAVIDSTGSAKKKRQAIAEYKSQITPAEVDNIANWSDKFGGGERIWIPQSVRWAGLVIGEEPSRVLQRTATPGQSTIGPG